VTRYFQTVGVLGNYYDIALEINYSPWLEYFTGGIIDELLRVEKLLPQHRLRPQDELQPYHRQILDFIKENGYITDRDYASLVRRARQTRRLDFKKLIEMRLIQREGKGKNTYYKLREA
jgi:predicted HTH transcriptional regulator